MLTVANYHYIREDFSAPYPSIFGVTPDAFEAQLKKLRNAGDFIHPNELLSNPDACLSANDNYFLVTFDDGLCEQYELALPILDALDIPAVFFANSINRELGKVSTVHKIHLLRSKLSPAELGAQLTASDAPALLDEEKQKAIAVYRYDDANSAALKYLLNFKMDFNTQERVIKSIFDGHFSEEEILENLYMTTAQHQHLARLSFLGSHTHSHYPLSLLDANAMSFELAHAKEYFEQVTGAKIMMVSYPYGTDEACTPEVAASAKTAGHILGFTTKRGVNKSDSDHLLLDRFDCNDLPGGKNYREK